MQESLGEIRVIKQSLLIAIILEIVCMALFAKLRDHIMHPQSLTIVTY